MATSPSPPNQAAARIFKKVARPFEKVRHAAKDVKAKLEEDALVKKAREQLLSEYTEADTKIHWLNELERRKLLKELPTDVMTGAFRILVRKGADNPERQGKDAVRFASAFFAVSQHSDRRNFARLIVPDIHQPNPDVLPFALYASLFNLGCPFNATQQALIVGWAAAEEDKRKNVLENENLYARAREMFPKGAVMLDKQRTEQLDKIDAKVNF